LNLNPAYNPVKPREAYISLPTPSRVISPGRFPNTRFCISERIVSPGVFNAVPNTPAKNPDINLLTAVVVLLLGIPRDNIALSTFSSNQLNIVINKII